MNKARILKPEIENAVELEGFESYDYEYGAVEAKASVSTVVELINDSVSAAEAEAAANDGVPSLEYAPLSWEVKRVAEFCNDYDDFINDVDFKADVFGVQKLEMENFWAALERNKEKRARKGENGSARVLNRIETAGKSTVYQIGNHKVTFGYLINNMTYDGQYAYFMTSGRAAGAARVPFKQTGRYPAEIDVITGKLTKWGKIVAKVAASGETATGAWAVLESEDAQVFYGEMKKHNWLSQQDKQLLKAVRREAGGMTFSAYKETLEDRKNELADIVAEFEETGVLPAEFDYIVDAEAELDEITDKLVSYNEEHNSEAAITELGDYAW